MSAIHSPDDPALDDLCRQLAEFAPALDLPNAWPAKQLALCGAAGVFAWFVPERLGGQGWPAVDLLRAYATLAAACLTTTFVITQRMGAVSRIVGGQSDAARALLLPDLVSGRSFATVGISHLTTSRQHLAGPVLSAVEQSDGSFVLTGYSPWVTGAEHAQHIVLGATLPDERQILVALPTALSGVTIEPAPQLVGLAASRTGAVRFDQVLVERRWLLAGPVREVMKQGIGGQTGGLQTSALAVGLASAAIRYLTEQSHDRGQLASAAAALQTEIAALASDLWQVAAGASPCTSDDIRSRANSLALRAAQAALAAAKGAGYVVGHPAGRWCREALFFLVWSCPRDVLAANLCELAGIGD
ncbi:MAG: acyl-CoA dehydrogenase family protein [Pirellulaceae bacterium]|nr:acyl-CoA dehydrogenase family protein [Pirellulaceae bacterium]